MRHLNVLSPNYNAENVMGADSAHSHRTSIAELSAHAASVTAIALTGGEERLLTGMFLVVAGANLLQQASTG